MTHWRPVLTLYSFRLQVRQVQHDQRKDRGKDGRRQVQSWALELFLHFFNNEKWFFAFSIKLICLGMGLLNRTGAKIGHWLYKRCKKIIFSYWKNEQIAQVPSWLWAGRWTAGAPSGGEGSKPLSPATCKCLKCNCEIQQSWARHFKFSYA